MATVEFYSKGQVDAKIPSAAQLVPSTSGATSGDVLTFDGSNVGWAAGGGGGGGRTLTEITTKAELDAWMDSAKLGDEIMFGLIGYASDALNNGHFIVYRIDGANRPNFVGTAKKYSEGKQCIGMIYDKANNTIMYTLLDGTGGTMSTTNSGFLVSIVTGISY